VEAGDLDQGLRRSDPDRWLTTRFIADPAARADVVAIYAYDAELTRARQVASNALMTEIRLTWWREVLDQIYGSAAVRQHPIAQALSDVVRRHGLPRAPLEAMVDARIDALEKPTLLDDEATAWARGVGGSAAQLAARALGAERPQDAAAAGEAWGLVLLRRAGLISGGALVRNALRSAGADARRLSVTAFPAALPATLARAGDSASELEKRARLICAALGAGSSIHRN
jgi:phytoene synthase